MYETEKTVRLKGNPFARPDAFRTDVTRGVTRTPEGTRICTLSADFLLGFRDAIQYECGPAHGTVLRGAGRRWGETYIRRLDAMVAELYATPLRDLQRGVQVAIVTDAFAAHGWGKLKVFWECWPDLLGVQVERPIYPDLILQADEPSDHLFSGFVRALFEYLLATPLDCVQTDCPTRDATASRFLLAAPERIRTVSEARAGKWGDEGTLKAVLASVGTPASR